MVFVFIHFHFEKVANEVDSFPSSLSQLQSTASRSLREVASVEKDICSLDCYLANWPAAAQFSRATNVNYNMKPQATDTGVLLETAC